MAKKKLPRWDRSGEQFHKFQNFVATFYGVPHKLELTKSFRPYAPILATEITN